MANLNFTSNLAASVCQAHTARKKLWNVRKTMMRAFSDEQKRLFNEEGVAGRMPELINEKGDLLNVTEKE